MRHKFDKRMIRGGIANLGVGLALLGLANAVFMDDDQFLGWSVFGLGIMLLFGVSYRRKND